MKILDDDLVKLTYISIAEDFSKFPSGRYKSDGPYSGEKFREDILYPALVIHSSEVIVVDTRNVKGMPLSFVDESFIKLIDKSIITVQEFFSIFSFVPKLDNDDARNKIIQAVLDYWHENIIRR